MQESRWSRATIRCSRTRLPWITSRRNSLPGTIARTGQPQGFQPGVHRGHRESRKLTPGSPCLRGFGGLHLARANGSLQLFPILKSMVGILDAESDHGLVKLVTVAQVSRD